MIAATVLDTRPPTAAQPSAPAAPTLVQPRRCPECRTLIVGRHPHKLFCSPAHKRAWNNRWYVRGGVIAPLLAAARHTRGTEAERAIGRRARADADQLLQAWKDEDAAAARLSALAYTALRYRHGLVEVVR